MSFITVKFMGRHCYNYILLALASVRAIAHEICVQMSVVNTRLLEIVEHSLFLEAFCSMCLLNGCPPPSRMMEGFAVVTIILRLR